VGRLLFLVVFFFPAVAWESAVTRPLEEVVPLAPVVFSAEVVSAKETQS